MFIIVIKFLYIFNFFKNFLKLLFIFYILENGIIEKLICLSLYFWEIVKLGFSFRYFDFIFWVCNRCCFFIRIKI